MQYYTRNIESSLLIIMSSTSQTIFLLDNIPLLSGSKVFRPVVVVQARLSHTGQTAEMHLDML